MNYQFIKIFFICFLILLPNVAFGLSGWSEVENDCIYSSDLNIKFGHPSDRCSPVFNKNQRCLLVHKRSEPFSDGSEYNIDLLTEINLPINDEPNFIIGQSYFDQEWLIYNISENKIVFKDPNKDRTITEWINLGNKQPEFANTKNFLKHCDETEISRIERKNFTWTILVTLIIHFFIKGVIPLIIILAIFFLITKYNKRKNQHNST